MFAPIPNTTANGIIRASYANFGFIPYGHSMVSKAIQNV